MFIQPGDKLERYDLDLTILIMSDNQPISLFKQNECRPAVLDCSMLCVASLYETLCNCVLSAILDGLK